jgi:hypothetical protein
MWLMRECERATGECYGTLPLAYVVEAQKRLTGLADFAVFDMAQHGLGLSPLPSDRRMLRTSELSSGALAMVGVPPVLGREFSTADERVRRPVALVTYDVWQGYFRGTPDVIGQKLWRTPTNAAATPVEIVGVLPRDFFLRVPVADPETEAFVVSGLFWERPSPSDRSFPPVLRLHAGVTIDRVRAIVDASVASVGAAVSATDRGLAARLDPADRPGWMKY